MMDDLSLTLDQKKAMKRVKDTLNLGLKESPQVVDALFEFRYPIPWTNEDVESGKYDDYPFVVLHRGQKEQSTFWVGLMGVLTGVLQQALELPTEARLCMTVESDDTIHRFYWIWSEPGKEYVEIELDDLEG